MAFDHSSLPTLPLDNAILTQEEVAHLLGLHPSTLANWRVHAQGPVFLALGSAVRYRWKDVETWLESRRRSRAASRALPSTSPLGPS